jgi:hypothetical protein
MADRKITQLPAATGTDIVDTSLLHLVNPTLVSADDRNQQMSLSDARTYFQTGSVLLTGNQTVAGTKTFSDAVVLSTAGTTTAQAVRADRNVSTNNGLTGGGNLTADRTLGLTGQALAVHNLATNGLIARTGAGTVAGRTVTAGTGITVANGDGVSGNPTITNSAPHIATNLGITAGTTAGPIVTSSTGTNATLPTASDTASGVVTTGAQTWAGVKTFSSTITGSISGNAGTVTNGVYTTGDQSIGGIKSFTGQLALTPGSALGTTGTLTINFAGASLLSTGTLTGNITWATSNRAAGRTVTVRVINGTTLRTLTFPAGWRFVGPKPINIAASKIGILTVTSFSTDDANVVAAWAVES